MSQIKLQLHDKRFVKTLFTTARIAVDKSVKLGDKQFRKNISLRDHSLADLAALDHPYAARHGSKGKSLHNPWWLIHKQSGGLLSDSVQAPQIYETTDSVVGNFGFEPDELPVALVGGTSRMIPRPVISGTLIEIKEKVKDIVVKTFRGRYGSNLNIGVGFGG